MLAIAVALVVVLLFLIEDPTPFTDLTPKYNSLTVEADATAKLTMIDGKLEVITVPYAK